MSGNWDLTLLDRWRQVPAAVAADVSGGRCLISPDIRPLLPPGRQPRLFGTAVTAQVTAPDFGAVLRALEAVGKGDVLVIADGAPGDHAMIGGILGGFLHRRGAAGIVCGSTIRDVAELAAMEDFAVYARRISPLGPTGAAGGAVNVPVAVGGRSISPGDLLIGDDDGLASLTPGEAGALIGKAEAKLALEEEWQRRLKAGDAVAAVFGLDAP